MYEYIRRMYAVMMGPTLQATLKKFARIARNGRHASAKERKMISIDAGGEIC